MDKSVSLFSMTCGELEDYFALYLKKGSFYPRALYRKVMAYGRLDIDNFSFFQKSSKLLSELKKRLGFLDAYVLESFKAEDSIKFLTSFEDGLCAESVVLFMGNHETLCISTQLGCRMNCAFCETAKMGFLRQLKVEEIVFQVFLARFYLKRPIRNIVYMGMGEPLDNFDAVIKAAEVLADQRGFNIALSRQTLSSSGLVPEIRRFAALKGKKPHLSISLNAARDSLRDYLMPINKRYPLEILKKALLDFPLPPKGVIFLSYVIIPGLNDSREDAEALFEFSQGLSVKINLIPYNPINETEWPPAEDEDIHRFAACLYERGLFVRKRFSRGRELSAACGQLGGKRKRDFHE